MRYVEAGKTGPKKTIIKIACYGKCVFREM